MSAKLAKKSFIKHNRACYRFPKQPSSALYVTLPLYLLDGRANDGLHTHDCFPEDLGTIFHTSPQTIAQTYNTEFLYLTVSEVRNQELGFVYSIIMPVHKELGGYCTRIYISSRTNRVSAYLATITRLNGSRDLIGKIVSFNW